GSGTTGGGSGTTGGGSGTTGGGTGSCDGCIHPVVGCVIYANSNTQSICGQGGVTCQECSGSTPVCNQSTRTCVSGGTGGGTGSTGGGTGSTGGGTGSTGGGSGSGNQPVGGACTSNSNCASGLYCKTATVRGDATYPGGYCTKACAADTECGAAGNVCVVQGSGFQWYGEPNSFCVAGCPSAGSQSTCRSGYQCEFGATGSPGICWLNPIPPFNGGGQATSSGNACTSDAQCQNPPNPLLGYCIPETGMNGPTGWTGGHCTADCSGDNTGSFCGNNATCVTLGTEPNTSDVCLRTCASPGTRSTCRTGYACFALSGGTTNICYPDCTVTGCDTGQTCNTGTGHCQ
ncbi:MAG: hypothetical protein ACO1OB_01880, partial [Archangium sp.]